jgi:hypothetical protein
MKSNQLLRILALSLLFMGTLAQAAPITGTVTNKTTGKPSAGDTVVLVDVQAGMSEAATSKTDARGRYSLNAPGSGPYLIRANHQGAGYFIAAPQGGAPGDITVYDVAAKVDGVVIDEDVVGVIEANNGQLRVVERYSVHNSSTPPRTQWSPRSFEIVLPAEAVVDSVSAQRPGPSSLPTTVKLDSNGPRGHYAINFPIQPDDGEKGTLFQIEYEVPYSSGKFTFHPQVSIPARTVWVVLPKSMSFASGAGSVFQSAPQDPSFQTFVARNALPGKALEFTVSGSGSMPREEQGAQGGQATGAPGNQPGGGIGNPINTPDTLSKESILGLNLKWWILIAFAYLFAGGAFFMLRNSATTAKSLEQRYHDGYLVARYIVLMGTIVKFLSLSLCPIVVIIVLANSHSQSISRLFGWIIMGFVLALLGFATGILITARGQIMQSMIDTAVNTSPLLDATEKAHLIGVPTPNRETPPSVGR